MLKVKLYFAYVCTLVLNKIPHLGVVLQMRSGNVQEFSFYKLKYCNYTQQVKRSHVNVAVEAN